jgi:large subunit ribosomal protein L28
VEGIFCFPTPDGITLEKAMSKYCPVTGKKPATGNRVSHANNRAKRVFEPNLHTKRLWSPQLKRFVRLRLSARALRIIDKKGIDAVLAELKRKGVKF